MLKHGKLDILTECRDISYILKQHTTSGQVLTGMDIIRLAGLLQRAAEEIERLRRVNIDLAMRYEDDEEKDDV